LGRGEVAFLIGVPLAWAILLLFHPTGEGDLYPELRDQVARWDIVHIGTMIFIPLMAVAVYVLLRGIEGTAAQLGRIALVPFALFYTAWEILLGIGTGVLVDEVNGLPEADQAVGSELVENYADSTLIGDPGVFTAIGSLAWITAAIAAAIALRGAGAPLSATVLLGLSALIAVHPPPFGPLGLAFFIAAVVVLVRSQSTAQAAAPLAETGSVRQRAERRDNYSRPYARPRPGRTSDGSGR
jgi:hypothetical protein